MQDAEQYDHSARTGDAVHRSSTRLTRRACLWSLLAILILWTAPSGRAETARASLEGRFAPSTRVLDPGHTPKLSKSMPLWDSWQGDDIHTGRLSYGPFNTEDVLELMVAGFPGVPGVTLELVTADNNQRLSLSPPSNPGPYWTRCHWTLPAGWRQRRCFLVAGDSSTGGGGWVGTSAPLQPSGQFSRAAEETLLQLVVSLLLLVPGFALVLWTPKAGTPRALAVMLIGSALAAYAIFFIYLLSPLAGRFVSWAVYAGCLATLGYRWRAALSRLRDPDLFVPVLLAVVASTLYFTGGYLYGGIESPEGLPMSRFLPGMPPDPLLPHWLAKIVADAKPFEPFFADWLTSDRPPLQAGLYLLLWPFVPPRYAFQVVGIAAQCWALIGLWSCLRQLGASLRSTLVVLAGATFAGFFFVNSVFCWPKHLPAAFLLLATGLIWSTPKDNPPDRKTTILATCCLALAMLGHGGSIFGVIGIAAVCLLERRSLPFRHLLAACTIGLLAMSPWLLYQRFVDPPGDRLVKYHVAGREAIDPRGSLTVIREAYSETPWTEIVRYKLSNLRTFFCAPDWRLMPGLKDYLGAMFKGASRDPSTHQFRYGLRATEFHHYLQSLGFLVAGLAGLLFAWRAPADSPERRIAFLAARLVILSTVAWCLLMFKGNSTQIYQSSFFIGGCLFICAGLGLRFLPFAFTVLLLCANIVWFFLLWFTPPLQNQSGCLAPSAVPGFVLLAALSTLAIISLLVWAFKNSPATRLTR